MRFLASFPDLVATVNAAGVQVHQYLTGSFAAPVNGGVVRATTSTAYPWKGAVEITIDEGIAQPWTLSLRVPEWCANAVVRLGAEKLAESGPGTIELTRTWSAGDRLTLEMAMPPRATVPDPRIDAVRGTIALERGPLVYAVEDADLPEGTSVESLEVAEPPSLESSVQAEPGLGELTWITADAQLRGDPPARRWPYRHRQSGTAGPTMSRPVKVRALPYFAWGNRAGLGMRIWLPTRTRRDKD
jgi:DUF1680 family protein